MSPTPLIGSLLSLIICLSVYGYLMGNIITRYAAILLSRQARRPTRRTEWVAQCVKAVRWLQQQPIGLCGSIGMQTWELLTCLAVEYSIPLCLYLPAPNKIVFKELCREAVLQFSLSDEQTRFIHVPVDNNDRKMGMKLRDRMVCEQANLLLPVSVRASGNMSQLIAKAKMAGPEVLARFQVNYHAPATRLSYNLSELNHDQSMIPANTWLIHWTRSLSGSWPNERAIDFYRAILTSDQWPRSAMATLERMIATGRIMASARHMPQHTPTVCFSALAPREAIPLMRWRARYSEMSFEPYGVGIESRAAERAGLRPVRYLAPGEKPGAGTTEKWLCQSAGIKTDWRAEQEYRCRGDFDFIGLPPKRVILFCRTEKEARRLRGRFPYRAIPLFEDA